MTTQTLVEWLIIYNLLPYGAMIYSLAPYWSTPDPNTSRKFCFIEPLTWMERVKYFVAGALFVPIAPISTPVIIAAGIYEYYFPSKPKQIQDDDNKSE